MSTLPVQQAHDPQQPIPSSSRELPPLPRRLRPPPLVPRVTDVVVIGVLHTPGAAWGVQEENEENEEKEEEAEVSRRFAPSSPEVCPKSVISFPGIHSIHHRCSSSSRSS